MISNVIFPFALDKKFTPQLSVQTGIYFSWRDIHRISEYHLILEKSIERITFYQLTLAQLFEDYPPNIDSMVNELQELKYAVRLTEVSSIRFEIHFLLLRDSMLIDQKGHLSFQN